MGLSHGAIGQRERGATRITDDWLSDFMQALQVSQAEWAAILAEIPAQSRSLSDTIPVFSTLAAAGKRAFVPGDPDEWQGATVDRGTVAKHPHAFVVPVEGDSMMPDLRPGDMAVCEPILDEHDCDRLIDGRIVVVFGGVTERRDMQNGRERAQAYSVPPGGSIGVWAWNQDGSAMLQKTNPKYQPVRIPGCHDGMVRIAVVVEVRRKLI